MWNHATMRFDVGERRRRILLRMTKEKILEHFGEDFFEE